MSVMHYFFENHKTITCVSGNRRAIFLLGNISWKEIGTPSFFKSGVKKCSMTKEQINNLLFNDNFKYFLDHQDIWPRCIFIQKNARNDYSIIEIRVVFSPANGYMFHREEIPFAKYIIYR